MIVVVNDANILIDIIKLHLVDAFFNLNWEFHSTNLIVENELYDVQVEILRPHIQTGRLIIDELSVDDMVDLDVHGHLWVFDALIEQGCISAITGIQKLQELDKVNSKLKLPRKECDERIRKWETR